MKAIKIMMLVLMPMLFATAQRQYNGSNRYDSDNIERYFYDDDFDWRWDVRVRITNGLDAGNLTNREANRLYNKLENLERKEYAFQADGIFTDFEQQEIWDDVVWLNRQIGLELYDADRNYYGYTMQAYRGFYPWYSNGYSFNRFDNFGFGSIGLGYYSRNYYSHNHHYQSYRNNSYGNRNSRTFGNDQRRGERNVDWSKNNGSERGANSNRGNDEFRRQRSSNEGQVFPRNSTENTGRSRTDRGDSQPTREERYSERYSQPSTREGRIQERSTSQNESRRERVEQPRESRVQERPSFPNESRRERVEQPRESRVQERPSSQNESRRERVEQPRESRVQERPSAPERSNSDAGSGGRGRQRDN
jgi:hypothetical protein